jgi:hypothetical protein
MLPFWEQERKGQRPFQKGKVARGATLGPRTEGQPGDAAARQRSTARVR